MSTPTNDNPFDVFGDGDSFLADATSGAFQVEQGAADEMITELESLRTSLRMLLTDTQLLSQPPYMGESPAALWVSKIMHDTANDQEGMRTQIAAAAEEIPKFIEGLAIAKRQYDETEAAATDTINTTGNN